MGIVAIGCIKQTAIHGRDNFDPLQCIRSQTHGGEDIDRQAHRAVLQAIEILGFGDRHFEPAKRLGRHRALHEAHNVGVQAFVDLAQQRLATAVFMPESWPTLVVHEHLGACGVSALTPPSWHPVDMDRNG